jgi:hypothetical protein
MLFSARSCQMLSEGSLVWYFLKSSACHYFRLNTNFQVEIESQLEENGFMGRELINIRMGKTAKLRSRRSGAVFQQTLLDFHQFTADRRGL